MNNNLVSVIITTCNREGEVLKEAIDSVLRQTYNFIEIIVINDAPFYTKRAEIDCLISSYLEPIKYIVNNESLGANISRTEGVEISSGDIISFLDDDDKWDNKRIEYMVQTFNKGADIVYSDMYIFDEKSQRYSKRGFYDDNKILQELLKQNYWGGFSNVAVKKSAFFEVGGLDLHVQSYQDIDLWIRLAEKHKVSYIDKALTYYRISSSSISLNEKKKYNGFIKFLQKYEDLYNKYPICREKKLENEMVNFLKNGWFNSANKVFKMLEKDSNISTKWGKYMLGIGKFLATKIILKFL